MFTTLLTLMEWIMVGILYQHSLYCILIMIFTLDTRLVGKLYHVKFSFKTLDVVR